MRTSNLESFICSVSYKCFNKTKWRMMKTRITNWSECWVTLATHPVFYGNWSKPKINQSYAVFVAPVMLLMSATFTLLFNKNLTQIFIILWGELCLFDRIRYVNISRAHICFQICLVKAKSTCGRPLYRSYSGFPSFTVLKYPQYRFHLWQNNVNFWIICLHITLSEPFRLSLGKTGNCYKLMRHGRSPPDLSKAVFLSVSNLMNR